MLYNNVIAILEKCKNAELNDVLVAKDMLIAENREKAEDIREASDFLGKYYAQITKCNRLGLVDKIKEICEHANDNGALKKIFEELAKVDG